MRDRIETARAHIRSIVKHPLRLIKQQLGSKKARLRGLAKNRFKINVLAPALTNLHLGRGHLLDGA
jgi:IS5 family transposase